MRSLAVGVLALMSGAAIGVSELQQGGGGLMGGGFGFGPCVGGGAMPAEPEPIPLGGGPAVILTSVTLDTLDEVPVYRAQNPVQRSVYRVLDLPLDAPGDGGHSLIDAWNQVELSIEEFVEPLQRLHGMNVILDIAAFRDCGFESGDLRVTVPDLTARPRPKIGSVLHRMLRSRTAPETLGFFVSREGLNVTLRETAEEVHEFAIYDLSPLPAMDSRELESLLFEHTQTGVRWMDYDGEGGSLSVRPGNRLLVGHNREAHRRVHELLNVLAASREARRQTQTR